MSEYLPFWPKAAVLGYVDAGAEVDIYTRALPTNGFTEVVAQLEIDGKIISAANATIVVTPQISNDGVNWQDLTADVFTTVTFAGTYPVKEIKKITTVAAFMRFKIALDDSAAGSQSVGGTIMITGAGRS